MSWAAAASACRPRFVPFLFAMNEVLGPDAPYPVFTFDGAARGRTRTSGSRRDIASELDAGLPAEWRPTLLTLRTEQRPSMQVRMPVHPYLCL